MTSGSHLFIISAPSGAGKTTLCGAVRSRFGDLAYSVSYTTRLPRPGEREGQDYFFISREEFEKGIREGRWAEWAQVHGHFYGTSAQWIRSALAKGRDVLLDIDVQGKDQMVRHFPEAVTIFIMPPSMHELKRRLKQRASEDERAVAMRLENAQAEIARKGTYRHVVVNDELNKAVDELSAIIQGYRSNPAAVSG